VACLNNQTTINMLNKLMKVLFKAPIVRLCSSVYLSTNNLQIYSVLPSNDTSRRHALIVTYSNAETPYKTNFYLEDSADKEEFLALLNKQIALQSSGPLSDPAIIKWMN
jgi:hypothetical protein